MKVLHVTPSIGPSSGGMGTVALGLAREQRATGCDAHIWCIDHVSVVAAVNAGLRDSVVTFPLTGPRVLAFSRAAERRARIETSDIVHQHGVWTAQGRLTRTFRRRGIPTLVAPHGSLASYALRRSAWKKRAALAAFESANLRLASCLHATAEAEVRALRDFGLRAPVAVIPNGVTHAWLHTAGDAWRFRRRVGLQNHERILLFLSRLHPIKGLPLLIDAFALSREQLAGWRLVIAGPDAVGHRAEIGALAARAGVSHAIHFIGPAFGEDRRDAYAAAELFVLPTHSENFGVVIAEALGAGVPVVTTHGAPWQELEVHRCGWWVPVNSVALGRALAEAAARAPTELRQMGERGRALVSLRYTWPHLAGRAARIYEWLLGRAERPDFVILD